MQTKAEKQKSKIKAPGNYRDTAKREEYVLQKQQEIENGFDENYRKTALDGTVGQIAVISIAIDDGAPINIYKKNWASVEPYILDEMNRVIHDACRQIRYRCSSGTTSSISI